MKIEFRQIGPDQASKSPEKYVMTRFITAIDRVVASQSGGERVTAVAWAKLWHERVMSCSRTMDPGVPMMQPSNPGCNQIAVFNKRFSEHKSVLGS